MPVHNAYPCVEPWDESADNGGATSPGVTADSIIVALYKGQPDPLQQAIVEGAGADTDPNAVNQTSIDYLNMFADVAETYGRTLDIRTDRGERRPGRRDGGASRRAEGHRHGRVRRGRWTRADARVVAGDSSTPRSSACAARPSRRRRAIDKRAVPVADRADARAGRRAPPGARRQAARRQEGRVRGRPRAAGQGPRVRLGAGRDRDRRVRGPQRRVRRGAEGQVRRRGRGAVDLPLRPGERGRHRDDRRSRA